MNDEEIIALYFARDEEALTQTDKKYGAYCYTLANRILNSPPDAEETVSDTYLKAWENIPPTKMKIRTKRKLRKRGSTCLLSVAAARISTRDHDDCHTWALYGSAPSAIEPSAEHRHAGPRCK